MTDLPYVLPLLDDNAYRNKEAYSCPVDCRVCDWCDNRTSALLKSRILEEGGKYYDIILVADCVWVEHLVLPLLRTLEELVNDNGYQKDSLTVLISYQRRGKDAHDLFYNGLYEKFDVTELEVEETVKSFAMDGMNSIEMSKIFYLFECRGKHKI